MRVRVRQTMGKVFSSPGLTPQIPRTVYRHF